MEAGQHVSAQSNSCTHSRKKQWYRLRNRLPLFTCFRYDLMQLHLFNKKESQGRRSEKLQLNTAPGVKSSTTKDGSNLYYTIKLHLLTKALSLLQGNTRSSGVSLLLFTALCKVTASFWVTIQCELLTVWHHAGRMQKQSHRWLEKLPIKHRCLRSCWETVWFW